MSIHDKDHEDIDEVYGSLKDVINEAWEKVKAEGGPVFNDKDDKRQQIIYDHLFALVEKAILSCNGNDIDDVCHLVDAYDTLLAVGMAKDWIEEDETF